MKDPVLKLQLLVRAEMALARIRGRRTISRITLTVVALIFILLALIMLNYAGYHALVPRFQPAMAAFIIALADTFIAIIIFLLAGRENSTGRNEIMAMEIRDLAYAELNADIGNVKEELGKVRSDVQRIRNGFSTVTNTTTTIAPLLALLTKALKRKK